MRLGLKIVVALTSLFALYGQPPEAITEQGIALLQAGNLQGAQTLFARALKAKPALFEVQNLMGVVLEQEGQHEQAREFFLKAIKLQKNFAPAHANLALNAVQLQDYSTAVTEFRKALQLNPKQDNADGLRFDLALALFRTSQYEKSLRSLDEIKPEARDAQYHDLAGSNYRELGDSAGSIQHLTKAVDAAPENPDYVYDLAIALIQGGTHEQALLRLDAGIQRCPACANLYAARGVAFYAAGKNPESASNYETAVRLEPGAADIHAALGDLYVAAGAFDKAADEYEKAVRLDSSTTYRVKQARHWLRLQQTDKAEDGFRRVLAKDPLSADAHLNLGKIASDRGDAAAALPYLEKAVQLQPDNSAALYQLALAYRKSGRTDKAVAMLERFRKIKGSEQ